MLDPMKIIFFGLPKIAIFLVTTTPNGYFFFHEIVQWISNDGDSLGLGPLGSLCLV